MPSASVDAPFCRVAAAAASACFCAHLFFWKRCSAKVFFPVFLALAAIFANPPCALAQTAEEPLAPGYYTVVAAYRPVQLDYALRYARALRDEGVDAHQGMDGRRNYRYVYLARYTHLPDAIAAMRRLRREGRFLRVWVRAIGIHEEAEPPALDAQDDIAQETKPVSLPPAPLVAPVLDSIPPVAEEAPATIPPDSVIVALCHEKDSSLLAGTVRLTDVRRGVSLGLLPVGTPLRLPALSPPSGTLLLEAEYFGYKPRRLYLHVPLSRADTLPAALVREGDRYRITLCLAPYEAGDMYPMDDVYFYNNAAIMLPDSRMQLEQLLRMMTERPTCRIRLHGHTNGTRAGKLVKAASDTVFFALGSGDVREGFGSARKLSGERAKTIRRWLALKGVDPRRIKVKAWGGARMLYDQNRSTAYKNLRVEVEIIAP